MRSAQREENKVVNVKDVMPRLASADFRTTVKYTGPLEHQYIMSHWRDDYLNLWLDMRQLIATQGTVRPTVPHAKQMDVVVNSDYEKQRNTYLHS